MYSKKQSNNAEWGLLSHPVLDNKEEMVLESDNEESQVNTMLPQLWESTLRGFDDDRWCLAVTKKILKNITSCLFWKL